MAKRTYQRRSEDERIQELEQKVAQLRLRLENKQRKDQPVLKEFKKVQKVLTRFAGLAHQHARADLGNMIEAFSAGLARQVDILPNEPRRRPRGSGEEGW